MNRIITIMVLCLITGTMWAGDEDINPSVYQQFDPVTGFLVPNPQNKSGQHTAAPSQEINISTSGPDLVSSVVPQDKSGQHTAASSQEINVSTSGPDLASSKAAENNSGLSLYLMIGSMAVISILAVIFVLKRRQMHQ